MAPSTDPTRRTFLRQGLALAAVTGLGSVLSSCTIPFLSGPTDPLELPVESPEEALLRLMEGNVRFASGKTKPINESLARRAKVVKRQRPFASVFSCVDSRVPPELIFDRGLGDLFIVRTAGEVPDSAVIGSLEYGAYELEIPLLLVLGHKSCGAVKATIETIESGGTPEGSIAFLVDAIRPAVENAKKQEAGGEQSSPSAVGAAGEGEEEQPTPEDTAPEDTVPPDAEPSADTVPDDTVADATLAAEDAAADAEALAEEEAALLAEEEAALLAEEEGVGKPKMDLLTLAIRENVALQVAAISKSPLIADRVKKDRLLVVGGIYDLETGVVELTVGVPKGFGTTPVPVDTTIP